MLCVRVRGLADYLLRVAYAYIRMRKLCLDNGTPTSTSRRTHKYIHTCTTYNNNQVSYRTRSTGTGMAQPTDRRGHMVSPLVLQVSGANENSISTSIPVVVLRYLVPPTMIYTLYAYTLNSGSSMSYRYQHHMMQSTYISTTSATIALRKELL